MLESLIKMYARLLNDVLIPPVQLAWGYIKVFGFIGCPMILPWDVAPRTQTHTSIRVFRSRRPQFIPRTPRLRLRILQQILPLRLWWSKKRQFSPMINHHVTPFVKTKQKTSTNSERTGPTRAFYKGIKRLQTSHIWHLADYLALQQCSPLLLSSLSCSALPMLSAVASILPLGMLYLLEVGSPIVSMLPLKWIYMRWWL